MQQKQVVVTARNDVFRVIIFGQEFIFVENSAAEDKGSGGM